MKPIQSAILCGILCSILCLAGEPPQDTATAAQSAPSEVTPMLKAVQSPMAQPAPIQIAQTTNYPGKPESSTKAPSVRSAASGPQDALEAALAAVQAAADQVSAAQAKVAALADAQTALTAAQATLAQSRAALAALLDPLGPTPSPVPPGPGPAPAPVGPVVSLVVISADGCAPCVTLEKNLATLGDKRVTITKTAADSAKWAVTATPTLVLTVDGKEQARYVGLLSANAVKDWLQRTDSWVTQYWSELHPLPPPPKAVDPKTIPGLTP